MLQFSVIIPNYNHASFLKERIESVLNQTYTNFELIILDDYSTDNSRKIIECYREHPKLSHIVYNKKNSGYPSRQWGKGLQLAKGEWIWIAESDDIAAPVFLETLISTIHLYPSAGIVYCNSYKENTGAGDYKTTAEETAHDFSATNLESDHLLKGETAISNYLSKKNIILNISSALIRKQYLDKLIPELKHTRYYADWYSYISIAAVADISYCSQTLNTFRRHPGSAIAQSKGFGIKTDCFRILNLLSKQPCITDKHELVNYFTANYLKPGLKNEGLFFFIRLMTSCFFINPILAMVVFKKVIKQKQK